MMLSLSFRALSRGSECDAAGRGWLEFITFFVFLGMHVEGVKVRAFRV